MALKFCLLASLLLLDTSYAQQQQSITLDDLLAKKFPSCGNGRDCVPRFLCKNQQNPADVTDIINDGALCGYLEVCCDIQTSVSCGYHNSDGVASRISGENKNTAKFGEFPWMVAISAINPGTNELAYKCGGALIAPTVILTGAHCTQNATSTQLIVRAGEWDTQNPKPHRQDRKVRQLVVHEQFNNGSLSNDIAILIVDPPFEWQEYVRPICLPQSSENFDYSRCFATGWGKNKFGSDGKYQTILKKTNLPVIPKAQCQESLRGTRLGRHFQLHESFICAGGEKDQDTCTGDGGSPLVCPVPGQNGRYYHAGIVAWGLECGTENVPGVYTNVAYMRQWINEKLSLLGINDSHYTP